MLNDHDSQMLLSQLITEANKEHYEKMCLLTQQWDFRLVQMLGIKPHKDGDRWYFLYGDNIQDGVCGFGETPYKAMIAFNLNWDKK